MTLSLLDPADEPRRGRAAGPGRFPGTAAARRLSTASPATSSRRSRRTPKPTRSPSSRNCSSPSAPPSAATPGSPSKPRGITPTSSSCSSATAPKPAKAPPGTTSHASSRARDPSLAARTLTGLSSGEGLIWAVRDPTDHDPGITDRRLLVVEPEFASVLKTASRDISTLSPTLRAAWDGRPLAILTRSAPARASDAHIAVIGHITSLELQHHVNPVEARQRPAQPLPVHRLPPRPGCCPTAATPTRSPPPASTAQLALAVAAARAAGQLAMTPARPRPLAPRLPAARRATARPRRTAHRPRRSARHPPRAHLRAPRPRVRDRARTRPRRPRSSRTTPPAQPPGRSNPHTGDPLAEHVHAALRHARDGLTRSQLLDLLHRNVSARRLDQALANLAAADKVDRQRVLTGGRPAELWTAKP